MRGDQEQQAPMWSDVSPEQHIPQDQPLRPLRALADVVLQELPPGQRRFRRSARRRTAASPTRTAMNVAAIGIIVSLALCLTPLTAHAQAPRKVPRIGYLAVQQESPFGGLHAFRQALQELGYVEGQNIALTSRFTEMRDERARDLVNELVRWGADVIVARGTAEALAAKQATSTIPIVFLDVGDPVARGLVSSIARPDANLTGLASFSSVGLNAKRLELLLQAVPGVRRVAVLRYKNPALPELARSSADVLRDATRAAGVEMQLLHVHDPDDLDRAFAAMAGDRAGAVVLVPAPFFGVHLTRLMQLLLKTRLPAIAFTRAFAQEGGLMSYVEYTGDGERRAAAYVDKILKGARPAELPVEQPTKLELIINMKTAKFLGLTIPPSLLLQADQVIQ
jgi:putative tryptophan/tyrosine transport system substrate-binding protein